MKRIVPQEAALLVVDVQEKLAAAMPEAQMAALTRATTVLIEAARLLGVTVVATEQYPKGLGPTIAPIRSKLEEMGAPIVSKMEFSACDSAAARTTGAAAELQPAGHTPLSAAPHCQVRTVTWRAGMVPRLRTRT